MQTAAKLMTSFGGRRTLSSTTTDLIESPSGTPVPTLTTTAPIARFSGTPGGSAIPIPIQTTTDLVRSSCASPCVDESEGEDYHSVSAIYTPDSLSSNLAKLQEMFPQLSGEQIKYLYENSNHSFTATVNCALEGPLLTLSDNY